ncbi:hypothetical protein AB0G74_03920 [Streptomyces sp. NPDC020875]|uniref:hypothetical protein n=1 Tax=Streptomyces sp. NPDC020875 TaxID=3154898 RepID=UPI0033C2121B
MTAVSTVSGTTRPTGFPGFSLFRIVVLSDACSTAVFGLALLGGALFADEPLGLPTAWAVSFGAAMLVGALILAVIGTRPRIVPALSTTTWALNSLCALGLLVLVVTDVMPLTTVGKVVMLAGVAIVASFASMQYVGHRLEHRTARDA